MQMLNEGFYSWLTADNDVSISNKHSKYGALPVKMIDNKGNEYIEKAYEGYGVFGGKDYYDLMAEMNGMTREELNQGNYSYDDSRLIKPKIVSIDCTKSYNELPDNKNCPSQGYFYESTMRDLINLINENEQLNEAWETKTFKSKENMNKWIEKNESKYQIEEIFINNGWGVEYKPLHIISFEDDEEDLNESSKPQSNKSFKDYFKLNEAISPYRNTFIKYAEEIINNIYYNSKGETQQLILNDNVIQQHVINATLNIMQTMALPEDNPNYQNKKDLMPKEFNKVLFDNGDNNTYDSEWMNLQDIQHRRIVNKAFDNWLKQKMEFYNKG